MTVYPYDEEHVGASLSHPVLSKGNPNNLGYAQTRSRHQKLGPGASYNRTVGRTADGGVDVYLPTQVVPPPTNTEEWNAWEAAQAVRAVQEAVATGALPQGHRTHLVTLY